MARADSMTGTILVCQWVRSFVRHAILKAHTSHLQLHYTSVLSWSYIHWQFLSLVCSTQHYVMPLWKHAPHTYSCTIPPFYLWAISTDNFFHLYGLRSIVRHAILKAHTSHFQLHYTSVQSWSHMHWQFLWFVCSTQHCMSCHSESTHLTLKLHYTSILPWSHVHSQFLSSVCST